MICVIKFFDFQFMFRTHGWKKYLYSDPKYRQYSQLYDFDDYSSKGSAVHPLKKMHRSKIAMENMQKSYTVASSEGQGRKNVVAL